MPVSRIYSGSVGFGVGACGNPGCPVVSFATGSGGAGTVGLVCVGGCVVGFVCCCATPGCVHPLISNSAMLAAACISLNLTMRSPTLSWCFSAICRQCKISLCRTPKFIPLPETHTTPWAARTSQFFNAYSDTQNLPDDS